MATVLSSAGLKCKFHKDRDFVYLFKDMATGPKTVLALNALAHTHSFDY